jgi:hypothetical protein
MLHSAGCTKILKVGINGGIEEQQGQGWQRGVNLGRCQIWMRFGTRAGFETGSYRTALNFDHMRAQTVLVYGTWHCQLERPYNTHSPTAT